MKNWKKWLAFGMVLMMVMSQAVAFAQSVINPGTVFQPIVPSGPVQPEAPQDEEAAVDQSGWDHAHAWTQWKITEPAGEKTRGRRERQCTICGVKMSERFYGPGTLYRDIENREDDVRKMQEALINQGYLNSSADGNFGRKRSRR